MPRKKRKTLTPSSDYSDQLVDRISECQAVIGHLDGCPAWSVINKDLNAQKQFLDDNWQNINDEKKMTEARILKLAYTHLLSLRQKYEEDLKEAQKLLKEYQNPTEVIMRDYDNENNYDEEFGRT